MDDIANRVPTDKCETWENGIAIQAAGVYRPTGRRENGVIAVSHGVPSLPNTLHLSPGLNSNPLQDVIFRNVELRCWPNHRAGKRRLIHEQLIQHLLNGTSSRPFYDWQVHGYRSGLPNTVGAVRRLRLNSRIPVARVMNHMRCRCDI